MNSRYFQDLIPELATRAGRASISRLGFSSPALRAYLHHIFAQGIGTPGSYLGDPVFEATFGWQSAKVSMAQLSGSLFSERTISAMDQPPEGAKSNYRFPKDFFPYQHQLDAWNHLRSKPPRSVVVTSGTGSGKTECFMVPILDSLAREHSEHGQKLVGVRALFLYPLNALIQSQKERLHAWTSGFSGDIRFCLYNGNTPEKEPEHLRNQSINEVIDREMLRASPPPILVTNATMLEYMLVRAQDEPILRASQGKLKWIVLDEAHTYIGSQAAEIALLLRRVLHAFGVEASNVRFVATSATIGGDEAARDLQRFLAHLAGLPEDKVYVVSGKRKIPDLDTGAINFANSNLDQLSEISPDATSERYAALSANLTARKLRQLFVSEDKRARQLSEIVQALGGISASNHDEQINALRWLDLLTSAKSQKGEPFLPLRAHIFHNVLAGLWACADPKCSGKTGSALANDVWPFGKVFMEDRRHCDCGAPVFELRSCNDCNKTYLWATKTVEQGTNVWRLRPTSEQIEDEFHLEVETSDEETSDLRREQIDSFVLITNESNEGHLVEVIDKNTLEINPQDKCNTLTLKITDVSVLEGDQQTTLICPECGGHNGDGNSFFRRAYLGAPFLLGEIIPTLLENCPDYDEKGISPLSLPWRGRRLISFTDSRQGTARIAIKLQQESERNSIRSVIYRYMIRAGNEAGAARARELEAEIEALASAKNNPEISKLITKKQSELKALSNFQPVPWRDIVKWLVANEPDVHTWAHEYYKGLDPHTFEGNNGKDLLASILTMREFARRPKRMNSLETMGLVAVRYPKLDVLNTLSGDTCGLTLQEWKDFLKIALDFYVRDNTFIDLPESWKKWGGNKLSSKRMQPPQSTETQDNRIRRWPQCNKGGQQPRLVRLLSHVLNLDPTTPYGRDQLDSLLRNAWDTLYSLGLLTHSMDGYFLRLEDLAFAPIKRGWLCPVTRRVLDTTLRGVTPYLPRKDVGERHALSKPIEIPLCSVSLQGIASEKDRLQSIREWLNKDPGIQALRAEGVWSDLNDRIVEGSRYYRTAEHSAQQSGNQLKEYEHKFKNGRINLLSCSTTMEMGVDIGGISVVAMNNVPPHPANYLQRAGRAGRRSETRSIALTVCKNNPHDQSVLRNTLWPFKTRIAAPKVSLSSPIIIQRHVNSLLLSTFMQRQISGQGSVEKLNMAWWMIPQGQMETLVDRFIAWARCFDESHEDALSKGMRELIRHTSYEGIITLNTLTQQSATMVEKHKREWLYEYEVIQNQLEQFTNQNEKKQPAYKAISMQRDRLTGEYLLRELATVGVLPGYSFPTEIASLDTLTIDEANRKKSNRKSRSRDEDAYQRRDLPSRAIAVALREYAPGSEVVIDGLVYQSRGVTLNWHLPTEFRGETEIQNLRRAWRCKNCGSSGTSVSAEKLTNCPDCGTTIPASNETLFSYLDPAGFAVDLFATPHNDVSKQSFVPVQRPWVDARGAWRPLSNPARGQIKQSEDGTVFHYSAGTNGNGYAVCLYCGRAEPMPGGSVDLYPEAFQDHETGQIKPHKRLRGAQGGETTNCLGSSSSYAIKKNLYLGHESSTDVLEVILHGLDGKPLNDVSVAYSIAVAVRSAIAATLGIEIGELGCETKPVQTSTGQLGQAIVIYDQNASGYSSSVAERIDAILRKAHESLQCAANCPDACQTCLLQHDTRYRLKDLNRHTALAFIGRAWLDGLDLPKEKKCFGEGSCAEWQSLPEAIVRTAQKPGARSIRLYLHGANTDWDLAASPLRWHVRRWANTKVELVFPRRSLLDLPETEAEALASLLALEDVSLMTSETDPYIDGKFAVLAELIFNDGESVVWATEQPETAFPNMQWSQLTPGQLLISGTSLKRLSNVKPHVLPPQPKAPQVARIDVTNGLDGDIQTFGNRFLESLWKSLGRDPIGESKIIGITYTDRYIKNPLTIALFLQTVLAIKSRHPKQWAPEFININSMLPEESRISFLKPTSVSHDWETPGQMIDTAKAAFSHHGMKLQFVLASKYEAPHARTLTISLSNGSLLRISLDQGFSCWRAQRRSRDDALHGSFPFSAAANEQGKAIATLNLMIEGPRHGTYLLIDLKAK